jgi:hypothetical protein
MKDTFVAGYLASKLVLITSRKPVSYRLVVVETISRAFGGVLRVEYAYAATPIAQIATTIRIEA